MHVMTIEIHTHIHYSRRCDRLDSIDTHTHIHYSRIFNRLDSV